MSAAMRMVRQVSASTLVGFCLAKAMKSDRRRRWVRKVLAGWVGSGEAARHANELLVVAAGDGGASRTGDEAENDIALCSQAER